MFFSQYPGDMPNPGKMQINFVFGVFSDHKGNLNVNSKVED